FRVALQDALDENEKLRNLIEELKEKNSEYKQMLEEANSFIEVIKEEIGNSGNDDTGIDVNDISTADETTEDDTEPTPKTANED
ncbi:uncharacterized protein, partial [Choristoneura fumiferana]|uniref:uncharacterized protein n=1 Tax=Choristoneura fumiferana TaxID=7141 RepID=UPI003D158368